MEQNACRLVPSRISYPVRRVRRQSGHENPLEAAGRSLTSIVSLAAVSSRGLCRLARVLTNRDLKIIRHSPVFPGDLLIDIALRDVAKAARDLFGSRVSSFSPRAALAPCDPELVPRIDGLLDLCLDEFDPKCPRDFFVINEIAVEVLEIYLGRTLSPSRHMRVAAARAQVANDPEFGWIATEPPLRRRPDFDPDRAPL